MKVKILTLVTAFFCSLITINAQTATFQKGDNVLNLGLGFGGYAPSGYQVTTPSFSASFEVGIKDSNKGTLGIGGYLGYASYDQSGSYVGNNYWSVNRIMIGVRGAYHFALADKLDTYAGMTLGLMSRSWKWNGSVNRSDHPSRKPFGGDLFVGSRYYFSDKFAVMGELSLTAYLTLGVSLKF